MQLDIVVQERDETDAGRQRGHGRIALAREPDRRVDHFDAQKIARGGKHVALLRHRKDDGVGRKNLAFEPRHRLVQKRRPPERGNDDGDACACLHRRCNNRALREVPRAFASARRIR